MLKTYKRKRVKDRNVNFKKYKADCLNSKERKQEIKEYKRDGW